MISNLLEHVTNRQKICDVVVDILPKGGYIIVSGPHIYPYHSDPIRYEAFGEQSKKFKPIFPAQRSSIARSLIRETGDSGMSQSVAGHWGERLRACSFHSHDQRHGGNWRANPRISLST